jgi:hypothetical protein
MVAPLLHVVHLRDNSVHLAEMGSRADAAAGAGTRRPQVSDSLRNEIFTRRNRRTLDSIDLRMTRTPHAEETTWAEGPELLLDRFMGTAGR